MSHSDRTIPPGQGRVAAAARAGMFARSGAIVSGLVLLVSAAMLAFTGDRAGAYLQDLAQGGLDSVFMRPDSAREAVLTVSSAFFQSLPFLATVFVAGLLGALVPAMVARKNRGRTAVPLPKFPKNRFALTLLHLAGAILFTLLAVLVFRRRAGAVWPLMQGDFSATSGLLSAFCELLTAGGAILLLVGMAEIAIIRHSVWRTLFLDSMEAKREHRDAGGNNAAKSKSRKRAVREARG
jgi:flagellar biosynthesis protein FlhB